jgi:hypothetical protein
VTALGGVDAPVTTSCGRCHGVGHTRGRTCSRCGGSGQEPTPVTIAAQCPTCALGVLFVRATVADGTRTSTAICADCGATAYVTHDGVEVTSVAKGAA